MAGIREGMREARLRAFKAAQMAVDADEPGAVFQLMNAVEALEEDERCAWCNARIVDYAIDAMVSTKRGRPSRLMHSVCFFEELDSDVRTREMGVVH